MINKYQHIESRLDIKETLGLLESEICIQPKLDGSNCQIYLEDSKVVITSRNNILSLIKDNANCYNILAKQDKYLQFLFKYPDSKLCGEWLVQHKINYKTEAYREFYVFDIANLCPTDENTKYQSPRNYEKILQEYDIKYVPSLFMDKLPINPLELDICRYLLNEDAPGGEGLVIKNYTYKNPYGRSTWCKIINHDIFKMKSPRSPKEIIDRSKEEAFITRYLSEHLFDKCYNKINDQMEFTNKNIGQFIRMSQLEFIEDYIKDDETILNIKVVNSLIAKQSQLYLIKKKII